MQYLDYLLLFLSFLHFGITQFLKVPASCTGFTCENLGTLLSAGDDCRCICPDSHTGLYCETELEDSDWPDGPYATPMSIYGCPEGRGRGWKTGYINITMFDKVKNTSLLSNAKRLSLIGPYDVDVIQMNFCYKMADVKASNTSKQTWPPGNYSIYRAGGTCPNGFTEETLSVQTMRIVHVNSGGQVPDLKIGETNLDFSVCERTHSTTVNVSVTKWGFPFILLKGSGTSGCPGFSEVSVLPETLGILSTNVTRYKDNGNTAMLEQDGFSYCLYKRNMERPDDPLEEGWSLQDDPYLTGNRSLIAIRKSLTINAYKTLYRDYPVTGDGSARYDLFESTDDFSSAIIPLSSFLESNQIPWVLIDLEQTIEVEAVYLKVIHFTGKGLKWTYADSPTIAVSTNRWAFLNGGAFSCDLNLKSKGEDSSDMMQQCSHPISGRYVSLYGKGYALSPERTASFFMQLRAIDIFGTGRGCGKELGMRDYGIDDFQISASSSTDETRPHHARPNHSGWCARLDDVDPYLQVDLLVATTIEGINVYNWPTVKRFHLSNTYTILTFPTGAQSFQLEYGFNVETLTMYKSSRDETIFSMDLSLPYHHEQTFVLVDPVVASVIRVRPVGFTGEYFSATCLKIELIGCRKAKLKTLQCDETKSSFWTRRYELLVSAETDYGAETYNTPDSVGCVSTCDQCNAIQYDEVSQSCSVFKWANARSKIRDFRHLEERSNVTMYQQVCLDDPVLVPPYRLRAVSPNNFTEEFPDEAKSNISDSGIVTSLGYPFPYDTGVITKWDLHVDLTTFYQVIFTNISLNVYQPDGDWYTDIPCEDKIILYADDEPSTSQTTDADDDYLFRATTNIQVVDNTMNARQVIYTTSGKRLRIRLHACLRESNITHKGNGFRVILKALDSASYLSSTESVECLPQLLALDGILISNSFYGLEDTRVASEWWHLCATSSLSYLNFTVTFMDLKCDEFAGLELRDGDFATHSFCNFNHSWPTVTSTRESVVVRFFYDKQYDVRGMQGFRAELGIIRPVIEVRTTDRKLQRQDSVVEWDQVCVPVFGRCYGFYRNTYSRIKNQDTSIRQLSARMANARCAEVMGPSARLVSIRGRKEVDFILRELAHTFLPHGVPGELGVSQSGTGSSYFDYAYIGLVWDTDIGGTMKARWRDGNPISYTAWAPSQPSDQYRYECTVMGVYSLHLVDTWKTVDCDKLEAEYFICEIEDNTNNSNTDYLRHSAPEEVATTDSSHYVHCNSGELVSRLFQCDGIPDCLDGTDEENCETRVKTSNCTRSEFKCSNEDCISISMVCDFVPDCTDGSDENCVFLACSSGEYRCDNHQCVSSNARCNYHIDCWDGSDEAGCDTCNEDTYTCGDSTCIPLNRQCDGFYDCNDFKDEENCGMPYAESCTDLWRKGYRETGVFIVKDQEVVCNFERTLSEGIVQTNYYSVSAERNSEGLFDITYLDYDFVVDLVYAQDCNQSVIQTCEPPADAIDEEEGRLGLRGYRPCICIRFIWTSSNLTHIESCMAEEETWLNEQWLLEMTNNTSLQQVVPVTLLKPTVTALENQWIKVEPIVCQETINVDLEDDKFLCTKGNIVNASRCMYEVDVNGELRGCRDMTHLQNCENTTCPEGYVKCPNSYCLSTNFLCDGERQCPGGQDELNCWCGSHDRFVVIIYDKDADLHNAALRLAGQLYSQSNSIVSSNVGLLRYSRQDWNTWSSVDYQLEYTIYLPRKISQFSEKDIFSVTYGLEFIPSVVSLMTEIPEALIVLQNGISQSHMSPSQLMDFDKSLLGLTEMYAVSFGRVVDFSEAYKSAFPVDMKLVHFAADDVVVPLPFGPDYCPELPPDKSPICPGMYRCHASRQCLAMSMVCDSVRQCPLGDDERLCDFDCPVNCSCNGFAVDCSVRRASKEAIDALSATTRYLDLHSNYLQTIAFESSILPMLITLNMSKCSLTEIPAVFLESMQNLLFLDFSFNQITHLKATDLAKRDGLLSLDLTGNYKLASVEPLSFRDLTSLTTLTIRESSIRILRSHTFFNLQLTHLDISGNNITTVEDNAFDGSTIEHLDITDNAITNFEGGMFSGISGLQTLRTDAYKFCCVRPDTVVESDCFPLRDEFSSCADLMRNEALRFLLWIIGFLALIGNILSLLYRLKFDRERLKIAYGIFVTHLAIADFLMGIYLVMIAGADLTYRGRYIQMDEWWRNSAWCSFAGVLATMSSEASVLFMCLITLDRIIVIKYPFGDFRFTTRMANVGSGIIWAVVANIATVPLWFTYYFDNQFYSRSGVCLALPLTRDRPPGWAYSSTVFIGFNFMAFALIAIGQFLIYTEADSSSSSAIRTTADRRADLKVARNLLYVVSTDFLCWFPIGVMGLMALRGHVVSSDVYAWAAVLILPVNSALNPFLYTFSAIVGRKTFAPSTEEQFRVAFYPKATLDHIVKLWDSKVICQLNGKRLGYRPLSKHLSEHGITPVEILRVGHRLAEAFIHFHKADLIHGDVTVDYVYVRRYNGTVRDAILKSSPTLISNTTQQKKDMNGFGQLISTLMKQLEVKG